MDCVWLILDSLSFDIAPTSSAEIRETMPQLSQLATDHGVIFSDAYASGPYSPSSHASFFTGKRPSTAGMHEAHPFFDGDTPTITEALTETHETALVSTNPFLFNGLERGFHQTTDLTVRPYLLFEEATDPHEFLMYNRNYEKWEQRYRFLVDGGKPLRSLLNALSYKRWKQSGTNELIPETTATDNEKYQYADQISTYIRERIDRDTDQFVVANYMDVHPPLNASEEALSKFAPNYSRNELPIGVGISQKTEDEFGSDATMALYRAAVWDLDRKVAPLIEHLVDNNVLVWVFSDHGAWFRNAPDLSEDRLKVPLMCFAPDQEPRTVDYTVNLKSIPHSTLTTLGISPESFQGPDLLSVSEDQQSISEHIQREGDISGPVNLDAEIDGSQVQYDIALVEGEAMVKRVAGEWTSIRGDDDEASSLRKKGERLINSQSLSVSPRDTDHDEETLQRLEQLGYLEE